jgi:hypothetical protein
MRLTHAVAVVVACHSQELVTAKFAASDLQRQERVAQPAAEFLLNTHSVKDLAKGMYLSCDWWWGWRACL